MTAAALVCGSCGTELRRKPSSVASAVRRCRQAAKPRSTSRSRCCSPTWCIRWTSPRRSARRGCARSWPNSSTCGSGRATVRRHGRQVHRRRHHGGVRRAGGLGGPRRSRLSCGAGIHEETVRLATEVKDRDGIDLQLRVGLNSGQVIAGEIGSGPFGYTTIGEQVGMAQRMESVAPPGRVMLSASTARLVDGAAALGEPEMVRIKGADEPVTVYRLLGIGEQQRAVGRAESNLVGRRWEMSAAEGLLDRAVDGHGAVVGVVGSPGIGKSRLVREVAAIAVAATWRCSPTFCESHASDVPFTCRGPAVAHDHRGRGS